MSNEDVVTAARQLTMKTGMITQLQVDNLKMLGVLIYDCPITITITPRDVPDDFNSPFPLLGNHKQGDIVFSVWARPVENELKKLEMLTQCVLSWLGPRWTLEVKFDDDRTDNPKPTTERKRRKRAKTVRAKRQAPASSKNKR